MDEFSPSVFERDINKLVKEEVGLRGAQTIVQTVNPDVSIVLSVDIAGDILGIKPHEAPTKMGGWPGT